MVTLDEQCHVVGREAGRIKIEKSNACEHSDAEIQSRFLRFEAAQGKHKRS